MKVELWEITKPIPYARNPRRNEEAVAKVASSIKEFGWRQPIVVDGEGIIIAGHTRLLAAQKLGLSQVPVHVATDLTPQQIKAYRLADNRVAEEAEWDNELLSLELEELQDEGFDLGLTGFDESELADLLAEEIEEGLTDEDAVPEVQDDPISKKGDLWLLDQHRLLCGDSTNAEDVERLMDGTRADLCFTSPPYAQQRDYTAEGKAKVQDWDGLMQGVFANLPMSDEGQVLVNLGLIHRDGEWIPYWDKWIEWMREQEWRRFGWYVWDKLAGMPGDWNGRLAPAHEFIWHFNRQPKQPHKSVPCKFAGAVVKARTRGVDGALRVHTATKNGEAVQSHKIQDSVFRCGTSKGQQLDHPATFPTALPTMAMESWGGDIYEPFCGSGTTLIAAEQLGRKCYGMEISPAYCDIIIRRWQEYTGKNAVHEETGKTFNEMASEP